MKLSRSFIINKVFVKQLFILHIKLNCFESIYIDKNWNIGFKIFIQWKSLTAYIQKEYGNYCYRQTYPKPVTLHGVK